MNFKKYFIIFSMFFLCSLDLQSAYLKDLKVPNFVTIYVHGTTTKIGLKFLGRFFKDVAFGQPGLHHIDQLPPQALLRKDALALQEGDSKRFDIQHFYTFGWSGKLKFKAREKDGKALYDDVKQLLKDYKKQYGFYPKIRLLTFSHGGNVALNAVGHLPFFEGEDVHLELVLVAVPVQKVTEKLIEHPCVNQSYIISSTRDLLQVVDFYRYEKKQYFPCRFFETTKQNCCQIQVMINGRGLGHIDLMRSFMIHLPHALNYADTITKPKVYLLPDLFEKARNNDQPILVTCEIEDPKFRFYKVFNLPQVVRGQRKA